MTAQSKRTTGGFLCGAFLYAASGAPDGAGYCHCKSCRHHTGAPVAAYVVFAAEQVQWTAGTRVRYESSPRIYRAFCPDCGTSLTFEGTFKGRSLVELHVGTLDDPEAFPPREHTHTREQLPWLHLDDDLPRFPASLT